LELKLKLTALVVFACLIVASGCGEDPGTAGKNISGEEYNSIATQGMSEADKEAQRKMNAEAAVPGSNQGGR
jgi:hypothetical protein